MHYFGTDGIRGSCGSDYICEKFFRIFGHALEEYAKNLLKKSVLKIVIGRDTRESGESLLKALCDGFSGAVTVLDCGVLPTPAIAYNTIECGADFGLAMTASHNPFTDNGVKVFSSCGAKLSIKDELELESFIVDVPLFDFDSKCRIENFHDIAISSYIAFVKDEFHDIDLSGIKILLDTANGATCETSASVLRSLGADVVQINSMPNGININHNCGSEYASNLRPSEYDCDLAIAHDGDGDRVIFVDDKDRIVHGDKILAILGSNALEMHTSNTIVATVQSNLALDNEIKAHCGSVVRSEIGDRNVYYKMIETGSIFGGENSGHMIFRNVLTTGDGLISAINMLIALRKNHSKLSDLSDKIALFPCSSFNINVAKKIPLDSICNLTNDLKMFEDGLHGRGRVLVRYSGTEPKLRVLVEAESDELVKSKAQELDCILRKHLKHVLL